MSRSVLAAVALVLLAACGHSEDPVAVQADTAVAECTEGNTRSCYTGAPATEGIGLCHGGTQTCAGGKWGECDGQVLPAKEKCDNLDNDCNGIFDDGCACQPGQTKPCYTGPPATEGIGLCKAGTRTCVNGYWSRICFGARTPSTEQCDRIDNDCNGLTDDGIDCQCTNGESRSCFTGPANADTHPPCKRGTQNCVDGKWAACTGEVLPKPETCNAIDDNCDGVADNGAPCPGGFQCSGGTCVPIPPPPGCPYVYAFDGRDFQWETTIGGGALLMDVADDRLGKVAAFPPMLSKLGHEAVDPKTHHALARLLVAEDEINYVDEVHLTAVEHPVGYEVFSSTSVDMKNARGPQDLFALRTASLHAPLRASWMGTKDVTREIGTIDEHAVAYDKTVDNFYELDFGNVKDARRARLVIDGWKQRMERNLPATTPREEPRLEVQQADGTWTTAMKLGYPRGDRKAVAFDLGGVEWPAGRYKMRIHTGTSEDGLAMWYVDRVRLGEEAPGPVSVVELPLAAATLGWRGAPEYLDGKHDDHPRWNKDNGKGSLPAEDPSGLFTRYGDVLPLLEAADDRLVVMRQGDAITFDFAGVPTPHAGQTQTLFLRTELVFKRRIAIGANRPSEVSGSALPLPFHGMSRYPYAGDEHFPDDAAHRAWLAETQTRPGTKPTR